MSEQANGSNYQESDYQDRKRKYDGGDSSNISNKRSNSDQLDNEVYFKLLIPSQVAGSVIGRGGERIAQIQKDANVRIKMSKATDYYPNTSERICLIIGQVRSVLKAHDIIVEKIQEKPEQSKHDNSDLYERVNQIKLLVPNSTAGLIIGKGGMFIKQIKDDSGAFVQISSKQTDLPERIVSIEGDYEKRNRALTLVIRKISDDPLHNTVPNLNYSNSTPNSNQDQFNSNIQSQQQQQQQQSQQNKFDFNSIATYLAGLNNLALLIINCGGSFQMTADSLKVSLRNAGYSSSASMEIIDAITVLLSYGLITKNSPANLLASNPNIAGLGNMANLTSVLAASMVSTMANLVSNTSNNNSNNSNLNPNFNQSASSSSSSSSNSNFYNNNNNHNNSHNNSHNSHNNHNNGHHHSQHHYHSGKNKK